MSAASPPPPRVVYDAVVFVQALISGRGPAAACVHRAVAGDAVLFLSAPVLKEMTEVPLRPELTARYRHLTPERVNAFVDEVRAHAITVSATPPQAISLPRDPKDEPYVDLAVAVDAAYLVTWNERHPAYLMRRDTPEGVHFCSRFPRLKILSPPEFLRELDALRRGGGEALTTSGPATPQKPSPRQTRHPRTAHARARWRVRGEASEYSPATRRRGRCGSAPRPISPCRTAPLAGWRLR